MVLTVMHIVLKIYLIVLVHTSVMLKITHGISVRVSGITTITTATYFSSIILLPHFSHCITLIVIYFYHQIILNSGYVDMWGTAQMLALFIGLFLKKLPYTNF